jgi:hypothetical protein
MHNLCTAGVSFSPDAAEAVAASMASGSWSGPVQVHSLGRAAKSSFRQQLEAAAEADEGRCGGAVACCEHAVEMLRTMHFVRGIGLFPIV